MKQNNDKINSIKIFTILYTSNAFPISNIDNLVLNFVFVNIIKLSRLLIETLMHFFKNIFLIDKHRHKY